ncbi:hypothetical protein BCR33DRAFT_786494 [Rhizoclosmatium globosum]|uniref:MFS general substrate transporter n=1 Tax=Rhizoclosmatium globosum TaxID=329046 RepID=A0A1Y2C7J6_9FUNG|nr:hypothetical protein BCR33DRAFT_786494 [Rhizoclosmatium globosum]|eukprot:ORY42285.1 hypothetical protein BCR33DRAFT_786494 [Rhizoclosmatium globosum]
MATSVFFAIGFTWTVEFAYGTPLLLELQVPPPLLALHERVGPPSPFIAFFGATLCVAACLVGSAQTLNAPLVAITGFIALDFSVNGMTAVARALVVDVDPRNQHKATQMAACGTVAGYLAGYLDLSLTGIPLSQLQLLCTVCVAVIVICVSHTCISAHEDPLKAQVQADQCELTFWILSLLSWRNSRVFLVPSPQSALFNSGLG